MKILALAVVLLLGTFAVGCVRISDGTWWIRSAATPENWPELTPVGEVRI